MHFDEIPPWRTLTWPQSPKDGLLHTGITNRNAGEHPGVFYKVTVIYISHLPTLSVLRSVGGRKTNANSDGWRRPGWLNGWGSVYIFQMWTKDNSCQKSWRKMRGGDQCPKSNNQTIWAVIIHIFWSDCACSQEKGQNPENLTQRILDPEVPFDQELHSLWMLADSLFLRVNIRSSRGLVWSASNQEVDDIWLRIPVV